MLMFDDAAGEYLANVNYWVTSLCLEVDFTCNYAEVEARLAPGTSIFHAVEHWNQARNERKEISDEKLEVR